MKAIDVTTKGPPESKDRPELKRYFEDVLEAARLIEGQCSKTLCSSDVYKGCNRQLYS